MAEKVYMSIKKKVMLGCIVLGAILFFSSIMSIYEFRNMNSYVTRVISENIISINTARDLMSAAEDHNLNLMAGLNKTYSAIDKSTEDELVRKFSGVRDLFSAPSERQLADSVVFAYSAYMQVCKEAEKVWAEGSYARREWYFNRLQPVYRQLIDYVQRLTFTGQDALIENSRSMQDNFYRSMMPSMVSLILSLILVLLFNYYLNYFMINPLLKITKGIKGYRHFGKPYAVELDSTDELAQLNEAVGDLVDLNKSYKSQLTQIREERK